MRASRCTHHLLIPGLMVAMVLALAPSADAQTPDLEVCVEPVVPILGPFLTGNTGVAIPSEITLEVDEDITMRA